MDARKKEAWFKIIEEIGRFATSPMNNESEEKLIQRLDKEGFIVEYNSPSENRTFYTNIIHYLNEKAGTSYQMKFPSNASSLVLARRDEGYSMEIMKGVIDMLVRRWKGGTMEVYLRPLTIFDQKKFDNYAGQLNFKDGPTTNTKQSSAGPSSNSLDASVNAAIQSISNPKQDQGTDRTG